MKKALSLLLALMMAVGLVMPQTWATGLQETEPDAAITETQPGDTAEPDAQLPQADTMSGNSAGLTPITRTKNAVASGVTLEKVVMRNVNGSQVVGYLSEIDLSKDVTLKASYTGYYYDGSTAAQRKAMVQQRPAQVGDVPDHRPGRRLRTGLGYRGPRGTGHQRRLLQHADRRAHRLPHYGGQPGKNR